MKLTYIEILFLKFVYSCDIFLKTGMDEKKWQTNTKYHYLVFQCMNYSYIQIQKS
jgi:hypothetical protein